MGAGSWGTALAAHLARGGHEVTLWGRDESLITSINANQENERYLPGLSLPASLKAEYRLDRALDAVDGIVIATPCSSFIQVLNSLETHLDARPDLVWACKGIANGQLLHEVVADRIGDLCPVAVLSGPSFAKELVIGLPTAVTIASPDAATGERVSGWFHHDAFRAYQPEDIIGVQVAGALKNIYAIAAGISDGLNFGANARTALITRGLAELNRLGQKMGARRETLMGLAGVGDLILTCTDDQSRNRRFGLAIGRGQNQADAVREINQVVEGINTSREAMELAKNHSVDMPIATELFQVIHENKPACDGVEALLARSAKSELD